MVHRIIKVGHGGDVPNGLGVWPLIRAKPPAVGGKYVLGVGDLSIQYIPGLYEGADALLGFYADDVTVEAPWGPVHLHATPKSTTSPLTVGFPYTAVFNATWANKGQIVCGGKNLRMSGLEISGSVGPQGNNAAVRLNWPSDLIATDCYWHDNQEGILTGDNPNGHLWFENCRFSRNGAGQSGQAHNLYIGQYLVSVMKNCQSWDAISGHDYKSRARLNILIGNHLIDTDIANSASYQMDISGGLLLAVGNFLRKGHGAANRGRMIYYYTNWNPQGPHGAWILGNSLKADVRYAGNFIAVSDAATHPPTAATVPISGGKFDGNVFLHHDPAELPVEYSSTLWYGSNKKDLEIPASAAANIVVGVNRRGVIGQVPDGFMNVDMSGIQDVYGVPIAQWLAYCASPEFTTDMIPSLKQMMTGAISLWATEKDFDAAMTAFFVAQGAASADLQGEFETLKAKMSALQALQGDASAIPSWAALRDEVTAEFKVASGKLDALDALAPPVAPPTV